MHRPRRACSVPQVPLSPPRGGADFTSTVSVGEPSAAQCHRVSLSSQSWLICVRWRGHEELLCEIPRSGGCKWETKGTYGGAGRGASGLQKLGLVLDTACRLRADSSIGMFLVFLLMILTSCLYSEF